MTALDDLQSAAIIAKDGLDGSSTAAADLEKQTEDLARQFAALGNEGATQLLTESARPRLATVLEHLANAQQELDAFVQDCEQAKGSRLPRQPSGAPSSPAASALSSPLRAPLPNVGHAVVDERKFTAYSMDPDNPRNRGKWKAWSALGYDVVNDRQAAADDVMRQIREQLPTAPALPGTPSEYGSRFETAHVITGPNGHDGTVRAAWQIDTGNDAPRLPTCWLKPHRKGRDS